MPGRSWIFGLRFVQRDPVGLRSTLAPEITEAAGGNTDVVGHFQPGNDHPGALKRRAHGLATAGSPDYDAAK